MQIFVRFDNQFNTFEAGQNATGTLVVNLHETTKCQDITVVCKGKSHVSWSERRRRAGTGRKGHSRYETVRYTADEEYFRYTLVVTEDDSGEMRLKPGEHHYPFSFPLPPSIPSSFEGDIGYIRYNIKAVMNRTGNLIGWDFKAPFTVVSPLDLNTMPFVKEPVVIQTSKTLCYLFCRSGPLELTVALPCAGFVSGQTIPFRISVENGSKALVDRLNCALRKEVTYIAQGRKKKLVSSVVKTTINEPVETRNSKCFSREVRVPPLPPSELWFCRIIDLEYFCEVEAVIRGMHFNLKTKIPVTLGTVPLCARSRNTLPTPLPPLPVSALSKPEGSEEYLGSPFAPSAPTMPSDLPPPTYKECVGPRNAQVAGFLVSFVPRYPVWNFDQYTQESDVSLN